MSERGQVLVELVAVVPACVVCAAALVDIGSVLRDRTEVAASVAVASRAGRDGGDPQAAVRADLPPRLRAGLRVTASATAVTVRAQSRPPLIGRLGSIRLTSSAATAAQEVSP